MAASRPPAALFRLNIVLFSAPPCLAVFGVVCALLSDLTPDLAHTFSRSPSKGCSATQFNAYYLFCLTFVCRFHTLQMGVSETTRNRSKRVPAASSATKNLPNKKANRASSPAKKAKSTNPVETFGGKTVTPPKDVESKYFVICLSMRGTAKVFVSVDEANEYFESLGGPGKVRHEHESEEAARIHVETFERAAAEVQTMYGATASPFPSKHCVSFDYQLFVSNLLLCSDSKNTAKVARRRAAKRKASAAKRKANSGKARRRQAASTNQKAKERMAKSRQRERQESASGREAEPEPGVGSNNEEESAPGDTYVQQCVI